ncbi:MAG: hypothetical protein K6C10_09635 [Prevotella sp.]|nr:hypothetical protein [Prevotella sp.]
MYSKYGVLDGIGVGGSVANSGDIGFAKEQDFDEEDFGSGNGSNVWED